MAKRLEDMLSIGTNEYPVHCVALCACLCGYVLIDGVENFANGVSLRLGYQMHKGLPHTHSQTQPKQIARLLKNDWHSSTEENICFNYI